MIQTIFNGKKNYSDLGITLSSFSISAPSKKKIKAEVPFMNGGGYDMSTVGSNGEIVYNDRQIKVIYNLECKTRPQLWDKYSEVLEWLIGTGQQQLIFTDMPDCYYLAEVEDAPSFDLIVKRAGTIEVTFVAYPLKFGVSLEGSEQLWDPFNFDTDYMQDTDFDVSGSKTVSIYNVGKTVIPTVICNSSMTVTINGYTANFVNGTNMDYALKLLSGDNSIQIIGNGHIEFQFRKELL